jgi:hypothetical protein
MQGLVFPPVFSGTASCFYSSKLQHSQEKNDIFSSKTLSWLLRCAQVLLLLLPLMRRHQVQWPALRC